MADQSKITISGVKEMRAAIKKAEPEMLKALDKQVRQAILPVLAEARNLIPDDPPMSGWNITPAEKGRVRGGAGWPAWDAAAARKGIKQKNGARRKKGRTNSALITVRNEDAAGSIYEIAGRKSNGKGATGARFIGNLNGIAPASRVIYRALDKLGRITIAQAVADAYEEVAAQLQRNLDFNAPAITTRKK